MGATLCRVCRTSDEIGAVAADDEDRFRCLTFDCRVHAIDTLYKEKIRSTSDADNTQWKEIFDKIRIYDDEMSTRTLNELREELKREELKSNPNTAKRLIVDRIISVSDAFDTGLLSYLQAKVDLMKKLGDCLPDQGQSWEEFVEDMDLDCEEDMDLDSEEENVLNHVEPLMGLEVLKTFKNLTRDLMSAIEGANEDLEKSGISQAMSMEKKVPEYVECSFDSDLEYLKHFFDKEPMK
ncbi:unnamed protein product [Sphagnum troendelagicum]